jgi:glycine betaine/choline ABC-type transport system substrate-binding protein
MFPPYNSTLVMKQETAAKAGADLPKVLDQLQKPLTDDAMQELDARVDLDKKDPGEVAKEYLSETGLVK